MEIAIGPTRRAAGVALWGGPWRPGRRRQRGRDSAGPPWCTTDACTVGNLGGQLLEHYVKLNTARAQNRANLRLTGRPGLEQRLVVECAVLLKWPNPHPTVEAYALESLTTNLLFVGSAATSDWGWPSSVVFSDDMKRLPKEAVMAPTATTWAPGSRPSAILSHGGSPYR